MSKVKLNSISKLTDDGLYEIHPIDNELISGYIKVKDKKLYDSDIDGSINEPYSDEDIADIEYWGDYNRMHFLKIK